MSVKEYKQKMELYIMRANISGEERTIIVRFLSGLSIDIRDKVELFPYRDLNDLVQLCIKVKQQPLRKISHKSIPHHHFHIIGKAINRRNTLLIDTPRVNHQKKRKLLTLILRLVVLSVLSVKGEATLLFNASPKRP
uniref:Retrotransposon gag domain-containing protein n=1 Tax=Cajanus cajan TaxID=3821 RepID=A0A151SXA8_CAJCA|nr:hypothetical protein KK1_014856 [Cajanus cajan]